MRIAISTSMIQRGRSGVAQYVFSLVKHLVNSGSPHQFTLFVLHDDAPLFADVADGVEMVLIPEQFRPAVRNIFWHQTMFPRLLRNGGFQVAHVPSYRRLLWTRVCALVGTIHDLAPFQLAGKYDWKRTAYARYVVRRLAARQDQIIAVSRATAADIHQFFNLPASKVRVIYNGLDHDTFHPATDSSASEEAAIGLGLTKPFFLYVARLEHPGKNHVRLVQAFNNFKQRTGSTWLLALGGSDWHGAEHIHTAIAASPYKSDIRPLGFVPPALLPHLYRTASVFVYPSLFEGFGLPPLEAMACGCPVLCSPRGALAEVVADAAAIVNPESVADMSDWLQKLSTDEVLRDRLRQAGLRRARQFDWHRTAEETLRVYEAAGRARHATAKPELAR